MRCAPVARGGRCELRSEVTAADAADAVELMKESLFDSLQNQFGFADFGRSGGRSTGNKQTRQFLGRLEQLSKEKGQPFFTIAELVTVIDDLQLPVPDVQCAPAPPPPSLARTFGRGEKLSPFRLLRKKMSPAHTSTL